MSPNLPAEQMGSAEVTESWYQQPVPSAPTSMQLPTGQRPHAQLRLLGWFVALMGLWTTPGTLAQTPQVGRARLWIEPQVPENWATMIQEAMAAQLISVGVSLEAKGAPTLSERAAEVESAKADGLLAIFVFGMATADQASLTIIDVERGRSLGRSLQADSATRSAMSEAAALIARDAAIALLHGIPPPEPTPAPAVAQQPAPTTEAAPIGREIAGPAPSAAPAEAAEPIQATLPAQEAEQPPTLPADTKPEPDAREVPVPAKPNASKPADEPGPQNTGKPILQVQAGYQLDRAAKELGANHGLSLRIDYRGVSSLLLALQGAYIAPAKTSSEAATIVLQRLPISLLAGIHSEVDRASFSLLGGIGLEAWIRETQPQANLQLSDGGSRTRLRYTLSVQAAAQYRLLGPVGVFASLEGCIFINNFSYTLEGKGDALVSPARLVPRLSLGLFAQL